MSLNETIFQFCNNQGEMVFPINKVKIKIYDKELIDNVHFIKSNLVFEDDVIAQSKFKANGIVLGFNMLGDITYCQVQPKNVPICSAKMHHLVTPIC